MPRRTRASEEDESREAVVEGRRRRQRPAPATEGWGDDADTEEEDEEGSESLLSTARGNEDGEEATVAAPSGRVERLARRRERQAADATPGWDNILDIVRMHGVYDLVLSRFSVLRRLQQMRAVCKSWDNHIMNWPGPPTARYVVTYQRQSLMLYDPYEQRWARVNLPFALPPADVTHRTHLETALLDSSHGMLCLALNAGPRFMPSYVLRVWNVTTQTWTDVPPVPAYDNPGLHRAHPNVFVYPECMDSRFTWRRVGGPGIFAPVYVRLRPTPDTTNPTGFLLSVAAIHHPSGTAPDALGYCPTIQGRPFVVSTYSSLTDSWTTTRTQFPNYPGCDTWLPVKHCTGGSMLHCLNDGARHDSDEVFFVIKRMARPGGNPENAIIIYNETTGTFRELYEHGTVAQPPQTIMTFDGSFVRCGDHFYLVVPSIRGLHVYKLNTAAREWVLYDRLPPRPNGYMHGWRCVATEDCIYITGSLCADLDLIAYDVVTQAWTLTPRRPRRTAWRYRDRPDIISFHLSPNPCMLPNSIT